VTLGDWLESEAFSEFADHPFTNLRPPRKTSGDGEEVKNRQMHPAGIPEPQLMQDNRVAAVPATEHWGNSLHTHSLEQLSNQL
jgi:hypothetical protein